MTILTIYLYYILYTIYLYYILYTIYLPIILQEFKLHNNDFFLLVYFLNFLCTIFKFNKIRVQVKVFSFYWISVFIETTVIYYFRLVMFLST